MKLVRLMRGQGPTEAYLLQHQLEAAQIPSVLRGEALLSLRGEIPIGEAWPSVWVDAPDLERAQAVLARFRGPTLVSPAWDCPACGEHNEPTFGQCWSCLRMRDGSDG